MKSIYTQIRVIILKSIILKIYFENLLQFDIYLKFIFIINNKGSTFF